MSSLLILEAAPMTARDVDFYKEAVKACSFDGDMSLGGSLEAIAEGKSVWMVVFREGGEPQVGVEIELHGDAGVCTMLYSRGGTTLGEFKDLADAVRLFMRRQGLRILYTTVHMANPKYFKLVKFYRRMLGFQPDAVRLSVLAEDTYHE